MSTLKARRAPPKSKRSGKTTRPLTVNDIQIGCAHSGSGSTLLRVLCVPDVHCPVHDPVAWALAVKIANEWKPDVLIQLGDFLDLAVVSTYARDPRRTASLDEEVKTGNYLLDQLDACRTTGGKAPVRIMLGSDHADRVRLYLQRQAPEFLGFVSYEDMLKLDKRGWLCVPYKQALKIGECYFAHDVGRAGISGTRQSLIDVGHSIIMGHQHRLNVIYQSTVLGVPKVAASLGWLGDVSQVDYRHRMVAQRDWQHAVGSLLFRPDGHFSLRAHPIVGGRCEIDGVVY